MRTASPGGNDDIGAAGGPTEHDTRSAAWMTSLMVANWGFPSAPSQVIVPWDSRVLEGAREGRRLARPTRTPNKLSWWEMGSGSTRGRSPTWTLICKRVLGETVSAACSTVPLFVMTRSLWTLI